MRTTCTRTRLSPHTGLKLNLDPMNLSFSPYSTQYQATVLHCTTLPTAGSLTTQYPAGDPPLRGSQAADSRPVSGSIETAWTVPV